MANLGKPPCDEGAIWSGKAEAPCAPASGPWILAGAIIGSGMAFIDSTVTNVALPALQQELGATAVDAQWIVESYALLLAALILVGGSLGDHYGRRRIYALGVALFALASIGCGIAMSPGQLIAARAVQGIGGAPGAGVAVDHQRLVRGGAARQGDRHLVGLLGDNGGSGSGTRRIPGGERLVAGSVPHKRAARPRGALYRVQARTR